MDPDISSLLYFILKGSNSISTMEETVAFFSLPPNWTAWIFWQTHSSLDNLQSLKGGVLCLADVSPSQEKTTGLPIYRVSLLLHFISALFITQSKTAHIRVTFQSSRTYKKEAWAKRKWQEHVHFTNSSMGLPERIMILSACAIPLSPISSSFSMAFHHGEI